MMRRTFKITWTTSRTSNVEEPQTLQYGAIRGPVDIPLLDHVILGADQNSKVNHYSFRDMGKM